MNDGRVAQHVVSGSYGSVCFAAGSPAREQYEALSEEARAKLFNRFRSVVSSHRLLDKTKIRVIQGSDHIFEFKVRNPPLRALAFREGRGAWTNWYVTQVIEKPRNLASHAARAEQLRIIHREIEGRS